MLRRGNSFVFPLTFRKLKIQLLMNFREQRQEEALNAILESDLKATVLCTVGFGKTILNYKVLFEALRLKKLKKGDRILFLTYTKALYGTYQEEALIYKEIFGKNPFDYFDIHMKCYQSKILEKDNDFKYIWCDEVDMIGEVTSRQFTNYDGYRVLMSGTLSDNQYVTSEVTKRDFVLKYAPLVYEYSTEQGIEEDILIPYKTVKIVHYPDETIRNYKPFKNSYPTTERGYINTITSFIDKIRFQKPFLVKSMGSKLTQFLRTLPSKENKVKNLISRLEKQNNRILVFAKSIEFLESILGKEYVASGKEDNIDELKEKFNSGVIHKLGFSKSLKRGFTPKTVTPDETFKKLSLILVHPIGNYEELNQIIGRTIRTEKLNPDKIATIYVFVTNSSYEENWFRRSQYQKNKGGKVTNFLELNLIGEYSSSLL